MINEKMRDHIGHNVEIVTYGSMDCCLECIDCNEVIYSEETEKETSKLVIEIENGRKGTLCSFLLNENNHRVEKSKDCSHADTDTDYLYDTGHDLIRIQLDNEVSLD